MAKLFRGTIKATITKNGGFTAFGQPIRAPKIIELCAIVELSATAEATSVRADTSASRGNAQEKRTTGVLLFDAKTKLAIDDMLEVAGYQLRVVGMEPKFDLGATNPDHFRVSVITWIPT